MVPPVAPPPWKQVVLQARPVLRFLPPACRDPFFGQLATELETIGPGATADDVYKLAAFCRIVLQPLGRGGKCHCRQAVAGLNGRLARWSAGQYLGLVQEYLAPDSRRSSSRSRDTSSLDPAVLPE